MTAARSDQTSSALPPRVQAQLVAALTLHQRGEVQNAQMLYRAVLDEVPGCFDALHLLGVALTQNGAPDQGIEFLRKAVAVDGLQASAHYALTRALLDRRDARAALASCEALLALQPNNGESWYLRGNAQQLAGAHQQAVESYDQALRLKPNVPAALNNQGHSLRVLRRFDEALRALARAIELQPTYALAFNNRGLVLLELRRYADALQSFDRALALAPEFADALSNRGTALIEQRRYAEGAETFARLVAIAPDLGGALADTPLSLLLASDSASAQLSCAGIYTATRYPSSALETNPRWPYRHDRIRIAYLSGDFGEHAVSHLLAGVIERHDQSRFETIAVAWGRQGDGEMRTRLENGFDQFLDATEISDHGIASWLREREVDIAVDLMGHTGGQRTGIFAHRAAPLQVNYLGFPGASGAPYIDYLISDPTVIPLGEEAAYSEFILRLPHCYLPLDDSRTVPKETQTRALAGLPDSGFVFCAFNNAAKITPELFRLWMRLLHDLPDSVLWLRSGAREVQENLKRAAELQGIDASRLVFAPLLNSMEEHLARHRLADLFLDTAPYNAHATACDALSAGLPMLTCPGRSLASRVGASLLRSAGLPELIADGLANYEQLALALARDPARLAQSRERLAIALRESPLFNTALYCRHLETLYAMIWQGLRDGLPPAAINLGASDHR